MSGSSDINERTPNDRSTSVEFIGTETAPLWQCRETNLFEAILMDLYKDRSCLVYERIERRTRVIRKKLVKASKAAIDERFDIATPLYENVLSILNADEHSDEFEVSVEERVLIQYCLCYCYLMLPSEENVNKADCILRPVKFTFETVPPLYYLYAKCLIMSNRCDVAADVLDMGITYLERIKLFSSVCWPGTEEKIELSDYKILLSVLYEVKGNLSIALDFNLDEDFFTKWAALRNDYACKYRILSSNTKEYYLKYVQNKSENNKKMQVNQGVTDVTLSTIPDNKTTKKKSAIVKRIDVKCKTKVKEYLDKYSQTEKYIKDKSVETVKLKTQQDFIAASTINNKILNEVKSQIHCIKKEQNNFKTLFTTFQSNNVQKLIDKVDLLEKENKMLKYENNKLKQKVCDTTVTRLEKENRILTSEKLSDSIIITLERKLAQLNDTLSNKDIKEEQLKVANKKLQGLFLCAIQNTFRVYSTIYDRKKQHCKMMVHDLNHVLPTLTETSKPTISDALYNIELWNNMEEELTSHSNSLMERQSDILTKLNSTDCVQQMAAIITFTDIPQEPPDILHHNYINIVHNLINVLEQQNRTCPPVQNNPHSPVHNTGTPTPMKNVNEVSLFQSCGAAHGVTNRHKIAEGVHLTDLDSIGNASALSVPVFEEASTSSSSSSNSSSNSNVWKSSVSSSRTDVTLLELASSRVCPQTTHNRSKTKTLYTIIQEICPDKSDDEITRAIDECKRTLGTFKKFKTDEVIGHVFDALHGKKVIKSPWVATNWNCLEWQHDALFEDCIICLEIMNVPSMITSLTCQHHFHNKCIEVWLEINRVCPICRLHVTFEKDFPPLCRSSPSTH